MTDQSLGEFVNTHPLPARVKVTEGLYNPEQTDWEFSNGDVLDLFRIVCPTVELAFVDPASGRRRSVTASTGSPCLFRILPYVPGESAERDKSVTVNGVLELIRIWPTTVCIRNVVETEDGEPLVNKGDTLRLKRLVHKENRYLLECSNQHSELLRLPLSTELQCFVIEDSVSKTLTEITEIPGRVERRLRLTDDSINRTRPIRGLPVDVTVDLFMKPPHRFVEIHPSESPGEQFMAPIDIDITVSDRDDDYCGLSFRWYDLETFVSANHPKFPMVVSIADWNEDPISLQAIRASVGDRIVLYSRKDVYKLACRVDFDYFAVPLDYDAKCIKTFTSLLDACTAKAKWVEAITNAIAEKPGVSGVRMGDRLEILNRPNLGFVSVRINGERIEKLPTSLQGRFNELSDCNDVNGSTDAFTFQNIQPTMLPMRVVFEEASPTIPPAKDAIPRRREVQLEYIFRDSCVLASKDAERRFCSPIPTRAGIYVRYISQYKKKAARPELSELAKCPERLSEILFRELKTNMTYQNMETGADKEPTPPLLPRRPTTKMRQPPSPEGPLAQSKQQRPSPRKRSDKMAPPLPPRRTPSNRIRAQELNAEVPLPTPIPVNDNCLVEDEKDYEEIADIHEYNVIFEEIFGNTEPSNITVPSNADISSFSWLEMVVFLQLTSMPPESLRLFA
ncbi:hypothetical protein LSH36_754g00013 [Paralvinella palmiformis]|uniref:CABIT domain-containing protein n=1 Tax=Paralvinella palmiformis TaxID=53620 RepID=A0AAD9MUM8_9ANNE|nr:hypothetical protein LSH36_754g00013 [Paralvinella palmiformis]